MPRVLTKTKSTAGAERKCGRCGIKIEAGDTYFSWSFRYGGTHYRCKDHRPRQSELTQSKMSEVYAAVEAAEDELPTTGDVADIRSIIEALAETVESVASEYRDAAEPFGGAGENAERADELDGWVDELQSFYPDDPDEENDTDDEIQDAIENARSEAVDLASGCPL